MSGMIKGAFAMPWTITFRIICHQTSQINGLFLILAYIYRSGVVYSSITNSSRLLKARSPKLAWANISSEKCSKCGFVIFVTTVRTILEHIFLLRWIVVTEHCLGRRAEWVDCKVIQGWGKQRSKERRSLSKVASLFSHVVCIGYKLQQAWQA